MEVLYHTLKLNEEREIMKQLSMFQDQGLYVGQGLKIISMHITGTVREVNPDGEVVFFVENGHWEGILDVYRKSVFILYTERLVTDVTFEFYDKEVYKYDEDVIPF